MKHIILNLCCLFCAMNYLYSQEMTMQINGIESSKNHEFIKVDIPIWGNFKYHIPNIISIDLDTILNNENVDDIKFDSKNSFGMSDCAIGIEDNCLKMTGHVSPKTSDVVVALKNTQTGVIKSLVMQVSNIEFGSSPFMDLSSFEKITATPIPVYLHTSISSPKTSHSLNAHQKIVIEAAGEVQEYQTENTVIQEGQKHIEKVELTNLLDFVEENTITFRHYFYVNGHEILINRLIMLMK